MTDKPTLTDSEGPGVRATRALNKRWRVYGGIYVVVAAALTMGLMMGTRDPAAGPPHFTPEAAVAGAVLLPLLFVLVRRGTRDGLKALRERLARRGDPETAA